METQFRTVGNTIISAIPAILLALLLLLLAWVVATIVKKIVIRGGKAAKIPSLFQRSRVADSPDAGIELLELLGKLAFFLVFLFMIPSIFDALGMTAVSQPISNMVQSFLEFIPNIIAAGIILFVGWMLAKLAKELVTNILKSMRADRLPHKLGLSKADTQDAPSFELSSIMGNIVYVLIIIPVVIAALEVLNIQAISVPAVNMLNMILSVIPNLIVAVILVMIGVFIAGMIAELVKSLLASTGMDNLTQKMNADPMYPSIPRFSLSNAIGEIVRVIIVIFFVVEALNVLNLTVLQMIGSAVIVYLPFLIGAIVILGVGFVLANFVEGFIVKFTGQPTALGKILKYVILIFAVFMTLDQLRLAPSIVNFAFMAIMAGLAIAFAVAFGIGGKGFAARQLEKLDKKIEEEKQKDNSPKGPDREDLKRQNEKQSGTGPADQASQDPRQTRPSQHPPSQQRQQQPPAQQRPSQQKPGQQNPNRTQNMPGTDFTGSKSSLNGGIYSGDNEFIEDDDPVI
jgi:cell division protein FtsN